MKIKTHSLIGTIAFGGISTLALVLGQIQQAQAAAITLFNTGVNGSGTVLPDNTTSDPHYSLISAPTNLAILPLTRIETVGQPRAWLAPSSSSAWIRPVRTTATNFNFSPGSYTYRTTFDLTGLLPSTAQILGRWSTDNTGLNILLNGTPTGNTAAGFRSWYNFGISSGFVAGLNTLDFIVNNAGTSNNPTALRVEMTGTADPEAVPEPSVLLGTFFALGSAGIFKRKLTKKTQ